MTIEHKTGLKKSSMVLISMVRPSLTMSSRVLMNILASLGVMSYSSSVRVE